MSIDSLYAGSSFYGSFGNGKEAQLLFIIILLMLFDVTVSLALLFLIACLRVSCERHAKLFTICCMKIFLFWAVGRHDFGGGDLRDKIGRRHSPRRIHSPVREARGRNTVHGRTALLKISLYFSLYTYAFLCQMEF